MKHIISIATILITTFAFAKETPKMKTLYEIPVKTIDGKETNLSTYKNKVLLIVNTASECGYTSQYEGLQNIYNQYKAKGFEVLGFPSNDFGAQEPGSNAEIKNFCERKFKVSFPLFDKNPVSGNQRQPLYTWLIENGPSKSAIGWNFEKFLIGKDGKVVGRYKSGVKPESEELKKAIETAL